MSDATQRTHIYSAEATVLSGVIHYPFSQVIEPQVHSELAEVGGHFHQRSEAYTLQSAITFNSAYSRVAGNQSQKPGGGWYTVTTTVVEGLNILEVLTADRVVGQTITEHPLEGYVPSISFLGTRFENLRISGHPVELEFDPYILGDKPGDDAPYTSEAGVVSRIKRQYDRIGSHKELPAELQERYNRLSPSLGSAAEVECSLVNQATGRYPGHTYGHVIFIPGFGTITLGKVTVKHEKPCEKTKSPKKTTLELTMIDLKLGCPTGGSVPVGNGSSNGGSEP